MTNMRRAVLASFVALVACSDESEGMRVATDRQAFTSADAVLVDFDFDGRIVVASDDPPIVRRSVQTQLMYLVGQLNGDRAVARIDRADIVGTTWRAIASTPPTWELTYHVKLPVAWGEGTPPGSYDVALPVSVSDDAQAAFAAKYAATCADPEGGAVDAGRMFLFYRPRQAGCAIDPTDVVASVARTSPSTENTDGKYPEYQRVWEDGRLEIVAVFGHELEEGAAGVDGGVGAYDAFRQRTETYLATLGSLQGGGTPELHVTLADGREVFVHTTLTPPHLTTPRTAFDDWYDQRTPKADVIFYSGHAGLGENVRVLSTKGVFSPQQYVVYALNGCDTFAYLDDTLAKRREVLNPDDPAGTKYMDVVANVLGGYFHTGDETGARFLHAMVDAEKGAPKTYREVFDAVDPTQIMVVSGEEDNVFVPGLLAAPKATPRDDAPPATTAPPESAPAKPTARRPATPPVDSSGGCAVASSGRAAHQPLGELFAIALGWIVWARRHRRVVRRRADEDAIPMVANAL